MVLGHIHLVLAIHYLKLILILLKLNQTVLYNLFEFYRLIYLT